MASGERIGGIEILTADGLVINAKGSWTNNVGQPLRTPVNGADRPHGFTEVPQTGRMEGTVTFTSDLNLKALLNLKNATITMVLGNGQTMILRDAYFAGEGDFTTEEGELSAMFHGEADIDAG